MIVLHITDADVLDAANNSPFKDRTAHNIHGMAEKSNLFCFIFKQEKWTTAEMLFLDGKKQQRNVPNVTKWNANWAHRERYYVAVVRYLLCSCSYHFVIVYCIVFKNMNNKQMREYQKI